MEDTTLNAVDVVSTAWTIKGILSTVANFSFALKLLAVALVIFAGILAVIVAKKIIKEIYNNIILEIFSVLKKIFNFIFRRNRHENPQINTSVNSEEELQSLLTRNIDNDEVESEIIRIVNSDNNILNNKNDKKIAKKIRNELAEKDKNFSEVDLQIFEEIILKIRKNVELRMKLYSILKNNPRMIKSSISAITKTICTNLEIRDDETKNKISDQIAVVKKIYELDENAEDIAAIFKQTNAFEFEIKLFIKIFSDI